jgi:predicted ATPase
MKLNFENLGPIKQGTLQVNALTLLCGPNNSGKTYITNILYFLIRYRRNDTLTLLRNALNEMVINQKEYQELDILDLYHRSNINLENSRFKRLLLKSLAITSDLHPNLKLDFDIPFNQKWIEDSLDSKRGRFHIKKEANSTKIKIKQISQATAEELAEGSVTKIQRLLNGDARVTIRILTMDILSTAFGNHVFCLSAERSGLITFKNELEFYKKEVNKLLEKLELSEPDEFFDQEFFARDYPESVEVGAHLLQDIPNIIRRNSKSKLLEENPHLLTLLEKITGGSYKLDDIDNLMFELNNDISLKVTEASTSIKSLAILWVWVCFIAKEGSTLLIDEPELNLHPKNQRLLARFISELVKAKVNVFITTHSDYIIREFNSLILMQYPQNHIPKIKEKFGYAEYEKLNSSLINAYITDPIEQNNRPLFNLKKLDVTPLNGIAIQSFDDQILEMNLLQNSIMYGED